MKQYYNAILIDERKKITILNAYASWGGPELMEHAWIGNKLVQTVYSLIHNKPSQVVWLGDDGIYSDEHRKRIGRELFSKLLSVSTLINTSFLSEEDFAERAHLTGAKTEGMNLVNHDLKCYIDLSAYICRSQTEDGQCTDPLPLLTACGDSKDFDGLGIENVGAWAFHRLEYTEKIPHGYKEKCYQFIDENHQNTHIAHKRHSI
jgi:hypothetical protein